MTTTPAPTDLDLDELRDLDEAATPAPWQIDFAIGDGTHEISAAPDVLLCYCVGTDHDVTLIVKMRNALPRLLAELDRSRSQITAMGQTIAAFPDANNAANIAHARAQRDGYREELAKTRAELDATHAELERLRGVIREGVDMAEWHRNEVTTWKRKSAKLRAELANAKARISAAATVEVWTNEDGKRFVFADDLMRALDPNPEANPATTAEPADEPKATCSCIVQPFLAPPRVVHLSTCEAKPAREQCEQVDCHNFGGWRDVCGTGPLFTDAEPAAS